MTKKHNPKRLTRRGFLKAGFLTGGLAATVVAGSPTQDASAREREQEQDQESHGGHDQSMTVGDVDLSLMGAR